jgi:hypothetical protein
MAIDVNPKKVAMWGLIGGSIAATGTIVYANRATEYRTAKVVASVVFVPATFAVGFVIGSTLKKDPAGIPEAIWSCATAVPRAIKWLWTP